MRKISLFCLCAFCFACSSNDATIVGEWVQEVPNMPNMTQGIKIEKNGTAESINMNTLKYEKWEKVDDKLILSGKSIGNGLTYDFSDTLTIVSLTSKELSLQKGQLTINYNRKN